ncbi:MAG TPA: glycosyltransferase family 39 protein [Solirubrobacteraceae bacterium]|nr:glycosyltransferase family 39 protein [Solirubrobacteraceae bacterium]
MSASPNSPTLAASSPSAAAPAHVGRPWRLGERAEAVAVRIGRPELWLLIGLTAFLNLWDLGRNGWANVYYSAAVRSMSSSWHDFLYASFDRAGVMTVDKPPLALWVQSLSVRAFGYHPLAVLVPQALMGIATVALTYDLVRRRFGRRGGFVAGLVLALTPMTVAISRHNNPDALLVLACVAAVWCAVRGLEGGRTRWLVLSGVCVGLGFETKMGVALAVVPGIAAAWMWVAPAARGRLHALRQLLAGGLAMVLVGGAWPALVELTPAGSRPWVAGTSDNRVLSLILEYNGLGRVDGQAGGPAGGPGGTQNNMFGGGSGPLRLLNSALGGQVGWLLGFALVTAVAMLVACRLRRRDPRSGWLVAVGGSFLVGALLFSFAGGIFHPYYVSLLAPFLAALVGAGAGELFGRRLNVRLVAPAAIAAGAIVELVIRGHYPAQLHWLAPVVVGVGMATIAVVTLARSTRARTVALAVALAALLAAPAAWALDTLSYATSSTFPSGGPATAETEDGQGVGPGAGGRAGFARGFGEAGGPSGPGAPHVAGPGIGGPPPGAGFGGRAGVGGGAPFGGGGGGGGGGGSPFGGNSGSLEAAISYVDAHGGGTLAVSSQSGAAESIIARDANVAGIGGFSGRESEVSRSWLAEEVRSGKIRWVLDEEAGATGSGVGSGASQGLGAFGGGSQLFGGSSSSRLPGGGSTGRPFGQTRVGAKKVMAVVAKACSRVELSGSSSTGASTGASSTAAGSTGTGSTAARSLGTGATVAGGLYDCSGDAAAIAG